MVRLVISFSLIVLVQWYFKNSVQLNGWKFRWVLFTCLSSILLSIPVSLFLESDYPTIMMTVVMGTLLQIRYMAQFKPKM